jgi:hypothetical protein
MRGLAVKNQSSARNRRQIDSHVRTAESLDVQTECKNATKGDFQMSTKLRHMFALTTVCLMTVMLPGIAHAQVLIDQASASAGNITPGDQPGFPVTISESGSYRLSGNLEVTQQFTSAIEVDASDVSIDLNGFNIRSVAGSDSGYGIAEDGSTIRRGIAIRNGTITGFSIGIRLVRFEQIAVEHTIVHDNANIGIWVGANSRVSGNTVSRNGNSGIVAGLDSLVTGNTAAKNGINAAGIIPGILVGPMSTVSGNTASDNGQGMYVNCPSNIVGNTAVGNQFGNIIEIGSGCTRANNNP